jgi:resuscitation-promoting factor RpfB
VAGGIDGLALGTIGAGSLFLWAAVKGKSITGTLQALIKGGSPASAPGANAITVPVVPATASTGTAVGSSSAQQALQNAAAAYGWGSGAQWQALQNVEMAEAGFNPSATNPSSGAYGLAQALGHGQGVNTQGTVTNQYGGYGLSSAEAQAANSGDAQAQAIWMCAYIAATYGNPVNAWAHEQSAGWY